MDTKAQPLPGGVVIVFEGIDGAGKSTQLAMARDALVAEKWPVHTTRSLGGTPIGEALREVMLSTVKRPSETNLYTSLAIQAALLEDIGAQREQGKLILMDRGPLSLAAYEIYGEQMNQKVGWPYVEIGMEQLRPELTLIYRIDTTVALKRAKIQSSSAKSDYFESKPLDFFKRVARGYQEVALRYPDKVVVIDAGQSLETVHQQTMAAIAKVIA